jgi:hypothetical protein
MSNASQQSFDAVGIYGLVWQLVFTHPPVLPWRGAGADTLGAALVLDLPGIQHLLRPVFLGTPY